MSNALSEHFLSMAYNNAWANHRLLKACCALTQTEFVAPRTGFFPSIKATLNHILTVDHFYIDAIEREARAEPSHPDPAQFFDPEEPSPTAVDIQREQFLADNRLIAYCAALTDDSLQRVIAIKRGARMQHETRVRLLSHVFVHQIHHRGQVHAMLAGTSIAPPPLDEFFPAFDAPLRAADLAEMRLSEAALWKRLLP